MLSLVGKQQQQQQQAGEPGDLQRRSPGSREQQKGGKNAADAEAERPRAVAKAVGGGAAAQGKPRGKQQERKRRQKQAVAKTKQPQGAQSMTALTALGTVALYTSVRGGITVFHHLRRKYLRQLLFDLADALNELGLCYWLDFGSLLGVHRDGDLILHDNDIDLAVLMEGYAASASAATSEEDGAADGAEDGAEDCGSSSPRSSTAGAAADWPSLLAGLQSVLPQYSMRVVTPSDDPSARFIRVYCPLGMADVFGATPAGPSRLLVDCGHGSCTEISRSAVLPTGVMTWRGAKISVPGDIPAVLEERYGDWRTPKYMDKGADVVEGQKLYARIFRALSSFGIRI